MRQSRPLFLWFPKRTSFTFQEANHKYEIYFFKSTTKEMTIKQCHTHKLQQVTHRTANSETEKKQSTMKIPSFFDTPSLLCFNPDKSRTKQKINSDLPLFFFFSFRSSGLESTQLDSNRIGFLIGFRSCDLEDREVFAGAGRCMGGGWMLGWSGVCKVTLQLRRQWRGRCCWCWTWGGLDASGWFACWCRVRKWKKTVAL